MSDIDLQKTVGLCDECGAEFMNIKRLNQHRNVIHNKSPIGIPCNVCGDSFVDLSRKNQHEKIIHNDCWDGV